MKTKLAALFALALAALVLPLHAQETKAVRGVVTVVVGTSVTIASHKQGEMAYTTDAQTKILKLDGTAGTLADLKPGSTVLVTPGHNPNEASEIQLVPAKVVEKPKKP